MQIANRRAFTLVELMVSVALMIVLMLAITQIFSIAGKTMGGGQAIAAALRDAQAAQTVFAQDFAAVAKDGACFVIRSTRKTAYRNASDYALRTGGNSVDEGLNFDQDGDGTTETFSKLEYNFRNHRQDFLVFFARDQFPRQTGGDFSKTDLNDPLIADMSSREAAIFYHHLMLPTNSGPYFFTDPGTRTPTFNNPLPTNPGEGSEEFGPQLNANNYFANQWMLGRVALTLVEPNAAGVIQDRNGINQDFYMGDVAFLRNTLNNKSPIEPYLQNARFDLAGTTISKYKQTLQSAINTDPLYAWWRDAHMCNDRFHASSFVEQPLNAKGAASVTPIFVPACTQFIVEFAGDFVRQNNDRSDITPNTVVAGNDEIGVFGDVIGDATDGANGTDGVTDYVQGTGQIRWYGLPRDTTGDGVIRVINGDVVPVRDVVNLKIVTAVPPAPWPRQYFEKEVPTPAAVPPASDYRTVTLPINPTYAAAWGPGDSNRPKMIRITLGIDRPEAEGKLPDGQSFEYVFNVGY